jgi:hypothetical protein
LLSNFSGKLTISKDTRARSFCYVDLMGKAAKKATKMLPITQKPKKQKCKMEKIKEKK